MKFWQVKLYIHLLFNSLLPRPGAFLAGGTSGSYDTRVNTPGIVDARLSRSRSGRYADERAIQAMLARLQEKPGEI